MLKNALRTVAIVVGHIVGGVFLGLVSGYTLLIALPGPDWVGVFLFVLSFYMIIGLVITGLDHYLGRGRPRLRIS